MRYGLIEASANRIGTPLDYIALLCYHYDPSTGKYSVKILNVLRLASFGFVLIGGGLIMRAVRRERRRLSVASMAPREREIVETGA